MRRVLSSSSSVSAAPVMGGQMTRLLVLPGLMLLAGAIWAADDRAGGKDKVSGSSSAAVVKVVAVMVVVRDSHKPLAGLLMEVLSQNWVRCIRAPCPQPQGDSRKWQGTTDAAGVLRFPASLSEAAAEAYAHAVGSNAYVSVQGYGKRDASGRAILLLERPTHRMADRNKV